MKAIRKSPRTAIIGWLTGLSMIILEAVALLDGDAATVFDVEALIAGFALIGIGTVARDHGVNSEQAGCAHKDAGAK